MSLKIFYKYLEDAKYINSLEFLTFSIYDYIGPPFEDHHTSYRLELLKNILESILEQVEFYLFQIDKSREPIEEKETEKNIIYTYKTPKKREEIIAHIYKVLENQLDNQIYSYLEEREDIIDQIYPLLHIDKLVKEYFPMDFHKDKKYEIKIVEHSDYIEPDLPSDTIIIDRGFIFNEIDFETIDDTINFIYKSKKGTDKGNDRYKIRAKYEIVFDIFFPKVRKTDILLKDYILLKNSQSWSGWRSRQDNLSKYYKWINNRCITNDEIDILKNFIISEIKNGNIKGLWFKKTYNTITDYFVMYLEWLERNENN